MSTILPFSFSLQFSSFFGLRSKPKSKTDSNAVRQRNVRLVVISTKTLNKSWSDRYRRIAVFTLLLFAECEDVANVTLFLLSDYSAYVNGVMIPVDGGFLAG